jgi:hypothetical protein
MESIS